MTETQWRFLKAIADRVPGDRIVELRLFPTIRQGGAESGVAVVAVEELAADDAAGGAPVDVPEGRPEGVEPVVLEAGGAAEGVGAEALTAEMPADEAAVTAEMAWGAPPAEEGITNLPDSEHHFISTPTESSPPNPTDLSALDVEVPLVGHNVLAQPASVPLADAPVDPADIAEQQILPPLADRALGPTVTDPDTSSSAEPALASDTSRTIAEQEVALSVDLDDLELEPVEGEPMPSLDDILDLATASAANESIAQAAARQLPKRYAVLAARYRLTLKGPDRGKWDFEITHEADAPLDTVERVARGVARRAGDAGDPESFSAPQLRSTLAQPWWNNAT